MYTYNNKHTTKNNATALEISHEIQLPEANHVYAAQLSQLKSLLSPYH